MKALLVYSGNHGDGQFSYVFVNEQGDALKQQGVDVAYFAIKGRGLWGYLSNLRRLKQVIRAERPDVVHAHYGMSGALAVLQNLAPVVTTYHNGETLTWYGRLVSRLALRRSAYNIFVARHIYDQLSPKPNYYAFQPCGIWLSQQPLVPKAEAIARMGLPTDRPNILFGGAFSNLRKNVALARKAVDRLGFPVNLIEMSGWNREQVNLLLCACDVMLLPTKSEGSPQVVKEAMACNCPVVATDVADIAYLLSGVRNSYATSFDPQEIADRITDVLRDGRRSNGRERIELLNLDNSNVAQRVVSIYDVVLGHAPLASDRNKLETIAFYLPQYYPTKENDEWYGKGFTEWTNVRKSHPLFKGHYQPQEPADLGYYDLRNPETRRLQAELAHKAGISAFCYYHYWFGHGRQMLELPLNEVVRLGEPDMPFCLCWANHTWYKKTWDANRSVLDMSVLLSIDYGGQDEWDEHFHSLLHIFRDPRYYRIDGRLVFVFYKIENIPQVEKMMARWQQLAVQNGLPQFFFMSYVDDASRIGNPRHRLCDETVLCCKSEVESLGRSRTMRYSSRALRMLMSQIIRHPLAKFDYAKIRHKLLSPLYAEQRIAPTLLPNFDNTPRRSTGATILHNATPEQFYLHCKETFDYLNHKKRPIVFVKSWNEWGEGNYLEPDVKFGDGYIRALRRAIDEFNAENGME